jgi:hypothetical protein
MAVVHIPRSHHVFTMIQGVRIRVAPLHAGRSAPGVSASVASMAILSVMFVAPRKRFSTSAVTASSFSIARYISALFLIDLHNDTTHEYIRSAAKGAQVEAQLLATC